MKIEMEYYKSHSLNAHTHTQAHTNTHIHTVPFVSFVRSFICERASVLLLLLLLFMHICTDIILYFVYANVCVRARAFSLFLSLFLCADLEHRIHQHESLLYDFYSRYCCSCCCHFFPFEIFPKKNRIKSNQIELCCIHLKSYESIFIHTNTICPHNKCKYECKRDKTESQTISQK